MITAVMLLGAAVGLAPFVLKLLLGTLLFASHFPRRSHFALRLVLSFLLQLILNVLLYLPLQRSALWIMTSPLYYLLAFALSTACLKLLFAESLVNLIPCAVGGYMVEHISTQIFMLLFRGLHLSMQQGNVSLGQYLPFLAAQASVFLVVAGLIWFLFARNATAMDRSPVLRRRLLVLSLVTLCVVLVLSSVRDHFAGESYHLMVITRLFSIFSCLFLLYIRYDILEKGHLEAEHTQLRSILTAERKQFEQSRENIELINIKCHDMRHKLEVLELRGGRVDAQEFAEIREMIDIYDSHIHTGNEILDTILTERSLYCEKHGIRLSCMVDGSRLSFMSEGDICALFGNALENAIEAVSKLERQEDRIVSFQVRQSKGMLLITVDNYYAGELAFDHDLPVTTKDAGGYHGYGMKSIRMVAEKYGGQMTVTADELFHLAVLIPLPRENA